MKQCLVFLGTLLGGRDNPSYNLDDVNLLVAACVKELPSRYDAEGQEGSVHELGQRVKSVFCKLLQEHSYLCAALMPAVVQLSRSKPKQFAPMYPQLIALTRQAYPQFSAWGINVSAQALTVLALTADQESAEDIFSLAKEWMEFYNTKAEPSLGAEAMSSPYNQVIACMKKSIENLTPLVPGDASLRQRVAPIVSSVVEMKFMWINEWQLLNHLWTMIRKSPQLVELVGVTQVIESALECAHSFLASDMKMVAFFIYVMIPCVKKLEVPEHLAPAMFALSKELAGGLIVPADPDLPLRRLCFLLGSRALDVATSDADKMALLETLKPINTLDLLELVLISMSKRSVIAGSFACLQWIIDCIPNMAASLYQARGLQKAYLGMVGLICRLPFDIIERFLLSNTGSAHPLQAIMIGLLGSIILRRSDNHFQRRMLLQINAVFLRVAGNTRNRVASVSRKWFANCSAQVQLRFSSELADPQCVFLCAPTAHAQLSTTLLTRLLTGFTDGTKSLDQLAHVLAWPLVQQQLAEGQVKQLCSSVTNVIARGGPSSVTHRYALTKMVALLLHGWMDAGQQATLLRACLSNSAWVLSGCFLAASLPAACISNNGGAIFDRAFASSHWAVEMGAHQAFTKYAKFPQADLHIVNSSSQSKALNFLQPGEAIQPPLPESSLLQLLAIVAWAEMRPSLSSQWTQFQNSAAQLLSVVQQGAQADDDVKRQLQQLLDELSAICR